MSKEFSHIFLGRSFTQGSIIVDAKNEEMFVWKSVGNESIISAVKKSEISSIDWLYTPRGYELRLWKADDDFVSYLGFKEADYEQLESQIVQVQVESDIPFNKVETCMKGVNWGKPVIKGSHMMMYFEDKELFSISLADDIKNCQKIPKNSELLLEFRDDEHTDKNSIQLTEIRFVCPETSEPAEDQDEEEQEEKNLAIKDMTADALHEKISQKADLSKDLGTPVASFSQMPVLIPRGKYNVDLFKSHLRLYGRTYVHKITYKQISTLFLLPKPGDQHMYLVISLDTPFRQGQKSHFHIVFQIEKHKTLDEPLSIKLEKNEMGDLTPKMNGKIYEVFAKVLRSLTKKKLIGSGKYVTHGNDKALKCSLKANEGQLFFLEKSVFFLHKPVIYIRHDEIKLIKFLRASSGNRFFDLSIILKNGKSHTFLNIDQNESELLSEFLKSKDLKTEKDIRDDKIKMDQIMGDDDEEDDEDFVGKSDEEDEDASDEDEDDLESETAALLKEAGLDAKDDGTTRKRKKSSGDSEKPSKKTK
ncbi:predicted protein [Naegleria gruberi]|uniref:FACT complex subunit SSRP1 n=1 Tax=Naegleria gruberi TaxID=5762 RepID=D2VV01_NAEGR|nr:uncharacterized protein NAEGRDRAFT_52473 [Naegleria gruberi]EFC39409.1 predicted protein [Naegleria gruberi]|eukprot:XP_002672153.1 predicted protein [Naegleria gruberi strain NEG-M]